jgi:hypothetical protein
VLPQAYSFQVSGTNRTLNQRIVFTGNLLPGLDQLRRRELDAKTGDSAPTGVSTEWLLNSSLSGKAVVNGGQPIDIHAAPVSR